MLTLFKNILKLVLLPFLYISVIFTAIITIFKKVEWGLFLIIFLIPQPNIWYKLRDYAFGKDIIDILFFAIILGIIIQKKGFEKTSNTPIIIIFIIISYLALWNSSMRFSLPAPVTPSNELFVDWKNYAQMILLYFFALNILKNEDQQKVVVVLMSIIILLIAIRSYRNFSAGDVFNYDKRAGGPFETIGLGANHFGAFIADYCAVFLGLLFFDKERRRRWLFLATVLFGLHPLFFTYSRGVYLAAFGVIAFYGIMKKRSLLILVIAILLAWQTILPASVIDRITMTKTEEGEIEGSAASRLMLWQQAMYAFKQNPIFGVGFGGFGFIVPEGQTLTDTHNFYMKTLSEQGIIGIVLLILILLMAFFSGWRLFQNGKTSFHKGLGFGFMGCVLSVMITNMFGDRWSYFMLGSYFWIFWALVDRGILISKTTESL